MVEIPLTIGSYPFVDEQNNQGYPSGIPASEGTGTVQQSSVEVGALLAPDGFPEPSAPILDHNSNAAPPYSASSNSVAPSFPPMNSTPSARNVPLR